MDFLNSGINQLTDLFRSQSTGTKILTFFLIILSGTSLFFLFSDHATSPDYYLLGGQNFSTSEVNDIQSAFAQKGLNNYTVEGGLIRIPRNQQAKYIAALADANALPVDIEDQLLKVSSELSPFATRSQHEETLKAARQKFIGKIIEEMEGIEKAYVVYDSKKTNRFKSEYLTTASVSVQASHGQPLDSSRIAQVRHLVASAIAGLSSKEVTVVDMNGSTYVGQAMDASQANAHDNAYFNLMKAYNAQYRSSIQNGLSYIPGAIVEVNVELEKVLKKTNTSNKIDPKPVMVAMTEETTSETSESRNPHGPSDTADQSANRSASLSFNAPGKSTTTETSNRQEQSLASEESSVTESAPMTPSRVTVAISVPVDYYKKIWEQRNPTSEGEAPITPSQDQTKAIEQEETTKIREKVLAMIPNWSDPTQARELVTVNSYERFAPPPIPEDSVAELVLPWFMDNIGSIGIFVLALMSLALLRSVVKGAGTRVSSAEQSAEWVSPLQQPTANGELTDRVVEEFDGREASPKKRILKRRLTTGSNLKAELIEMVEERPDLAADILRSWITTPA